MAYFRMGISFNQIVISFNQIVISFNQKVISFNQVSDYFFKWFKKVTLKLLNYYCFKCFKSQNCQMC